MTVQEENDMGEPGVVEPRTEAGRRLRRRYRLNVERGTRQSMTIDEYDVTAIEDEARAAALDELRERVMNLQARWMLSEGDEANARCGAYDDVLDHIDAAIANLRSDGETR